MGYKPSYMDFSGLAQIPALAKEAAEEAEIKRVIGSGINWENPDEIDKIANAVTKIGTDKAIKLGVSLGELSHKRRESAQQAATRQTFQNWAGGQPTGTGAPMGTPGPNQYTDLVRGAAEQYGIPENYALKHQVVESGNRPPTVTSSAGAVGPLQIMPKTAQAIGVTDRTDPRQSIFGGNKHIADLRDKYGGNWGLAYAAYHAGEGNVNKFLAGQPSGVGPKTRNYVEAITGHKLEDWVKGQKDPGHMMVLDAAAAGRAYKQQSERPGRREVEAQMLAGMAGQKEPGIKESAIKTQELEGKRRMEEFERDSKEFAQYQKEVYDKRNVADQLLPLLTKASALIEDPRAIQGTGAETLAKVGSLAGTVMQLGKQFGIDVSKVPAIMALEDTVAKTQQLGRLSNQIVLTILNNKLGGQVSNTDREFVAQAQVALANHPDANRLLAKLALKFVQRDKQIAAAVARYDKEGGRGRAGIEEVLARHGDVFNEAFKTELAAEIQKGQRGGGGGGAPGAPQPAPGPQMPKPGDVRGGRRYLGGDPADPKSWSEREAPGGI